MKVTKSTIRQIIKEELAKVMSENAPVADLECHELKELMQKITDGSIPAIDPDSGEAEWNPYIDEAGGIGEFLDAVQAEIAKKCK